MTGSSGHPVRRGRRETHNRRGVLDRPVKPGDDSGVWGAHPAHDRSSHQLLLPSSTHTSALPAAKAEAALSDSAGSSISLWALPEGIIGKQFSSAATRQSNSTGFFTEIISLIAPSRSPGLLTCRPTPP